MPPTSEPSIGAPSVKNTTAQNAPAPQSASRLRGAYCTWMAAHKIVVDASAANAALPMPVKRAAVWGE